MDKINIYINSKNRKENENANKFTVKIPNILLRLNRDEYFGKLHFFLEILAFFQKVKKLFGKMARFSPFFWKSDFSKILNFFFSFGGRLRIMFHASENYF